MPTVSPLLLALRDAGLGDEECAASWRHVTERRATHMLQLAADLRGTGAVRADLDDQQVADLVWSTNSPEWFAAFTSRGRTPDEYAATLGDLWVRALLEPVEPGQASAPGSEQQQRGDDPRRDDRPAEDRVGQLAADPGTDVATDQGAGGEHRRRRPSEGPRRR